MSSKKTTKKAKGSKKKSKKSTPASPSWLPKPPQIDLQMPQLDVHTHVGAGIDEVVSWVSALVDVPNQSLLASEAHNDSNDRFGNRPKVPGVLPTECVRAGLGNSTTLNNGSHIIVARISQNERWQVFLGWGSSYPGHLLPTDPEPFTTEDLQIPIPSPLKSLDEDDTPTNDTWVPPMGFEWAPNSSWKLVSNLDPSVKDPSTSWIGGSPANDDKWTYASDIWLLPNHGDDADPSTFSRRRLWERRLVIYTPKSKANFVVDLSQGAGIGLSSSLHVIRVFPKSHAAAQGVKPGARVVAIAGESVDTLDEFKIQIKKCRDRGDTQCTIEYTPEADGVFQDGAPSSSSASSSTWSDKATPNKPVEKSVSFGPVSSQKPTNQKSGTHRPSDPSMESAHESRRLWEEAKQEVIRARRASM